MRSEHSTNGLTGHRMVKTEAHCKTRKWYNHKLPRLVRSDWLGFMHWPCLLFSSPICRILARFRSPRPVPGTNIPLIPTEVSVTASGRIEAHKSVSVMPEAPGRVAEIYVDLNELVEKGDVLAQLHAGEEKARLNVALADLDIAEIQLKIKQKFARQMNAALGESSANQEAVDADRLNADTELRLAQDEFARQKTLQRQGIVSKSRLNEAQSALALANSAAVKSSAGQKAAHFQDEVLQLDYEIALEQVQEAKSLLRKAEAQLSHAQADIEKTFIRAPIGGVIVAMDLDIGQVVDPCQTHRSLFTIIDDLENIEVKTFVDEMDIGQVRVGQKTYFLVDAFSGQKFWGRVREIEKAPTILQNVVTYKVIIAADNPEQMLLPGMTAYAHILTDTEPEVSHLRGSYDLMTF